MTSRTLLTSAALLALAASGIAAHAQEGLTPTQILVTLEGKAPVLPAAANLRLELNSKAGGAITSIEKIQPNGTQIAILIDDGLRFSIGSEITNLRKFVANLPEGTEVAVGFMQNGSVRMTHPFTTDHALAADDFHLPIGMPGIAGSPYFALSQFVTHWPEAQVPVAKARFVLMVTNGVDLYNGSTSVLNQDSPYVQRAIEDAQRAGVAVSSIYYGDAGIRGRSANFSGQSYLTQLAQSTGGYTYYQGMGNPVSLIPFLEQFQHDISETYVATFMASAGSGNGRPQLVHLKISSSPKLKARYPDMVRVGNAEGAPGA